LVASPVERVTVRTVERVVEVERAPESPPLPASEAGAKEPVEPRPASVSAPARRTRDGDLAAEGQLLDRARSALARGDVDAALAAIAEHARSFGRGQLAEAREALAVQALVEAGRSDEARARAARFHKAFPASAYAPVV